MKSMSATSIRQAQMFAKFINCLLVFICIWFTTIHHTFAYPLSQADMLDVNHPEAQTCEKIKDALSKPEYQTRLALSYIRNLVDNYTKAQFNKQSHEVHELWRKHAAHFYNGMERDFLPENFDGELEPQYTEHLNREDVPSPDELSMELQRIYGHLQILNKVFNIIKEDRLVNEHEIMHQPVKDDPKELYKIVNELFWEQARYSHLDIDEIETAMHALGIIPIKVEDIVIDKKDRVLAEWLATREYLKVLRYMHGVYKILIKRCS